MFCVPAVEKDVVNAAVAPANVPVFGSKFVGTNVAVQGGVPHAENVTVPVGPIPKLLVPIVAVKMTRLPAATDWRLEASMVVVVVFVTIKFKVVEAAGAE